MNYQPPRVYREPRSEYCEVMVPSAQIRNAVVPVDELRGWINRLAQSEWCRTWDIDQLRAAEVRIRLAIEDEKFADRRARRRAGWMAAAVIAAMAGMLAWCVGFDWSVAP